MRTLTLKRGDIAVWSDKLPFVLPGDFEFTIDGMTTANGEYVVTARQDGRIWQTKVTGMCKIPSSVSHAGELEISVALYLKGQKVTEWIADPITIVEESGEVSAMPAITALRAEVQALADKLTSVEEELETYKQAAESRITALSGQAEEVRKELTRRMDLIEGGYDPLKV